MDWCRRVDRLTWQPDEWWVACEADCPTPFESTSERETAHQLYAAVEQLPQEGREVIHLHFYQALTINDTAEALGIAASTVKYRLRNALDALQRRTAELKPIT